MLLPQHLLLLPGDKDPFPPFLRMGGGKQQQKNQWEDISAGTHTARALRAPVATRTFSPPRVSHQSLPQHRGRAAGTPRAGLCSRFSGTWRNRSLKHAGSPGSRHLPALTRHRGPAGEAPGTPAGQNVSPQPLSPPRVSARVSLGCARSDSSRAGLCCGTSGGSSASSPARLGHLAQDTAPCVTVRGCVAPDPQARLGTAPPAPRGQPGWQGAARASDTWV